jgi:ribosomal protein S18 acetylase RimI-like enzyme
MIATTKDNRQILLRKFDREDSADLAAYFINLSDESKRRYGPHAFDEQAIRGLYKNPDPLIGYIARDPGSNLIIAYSVIKPGYLQQDQARLRSWGLTLDPETDATYAPSVADAWQNCGLGNNMFGFILADLKLKGIRRIILWGGVQSTNEKAVKFYLRNGFKTLGQFEHNGSNFDMILNIQL